jgi:hypothetical protein
LKGASTGTHVQFPAAWTPLSSANLPHLTTYHTNSADFYIDVLINTYHCNKNGVKRLSSWSDTPLGPIPLKKIRKRGAKKVKNHPSPNLLFKSQAGAL